VIASAVGETVAQRAFSVLGGSIVEGILKSNSNGGTDSVEVRTPKIYGGGVPAIPPSPQPQPPGTPWQPQPSGTPLRQPQPPGEPTLPPSPQPQPPGASTSRTISAQASTAVVERPTELPANCIVLDEFLAPQELEELMRFALERESHFSASEVVSPVVDGGVVNYEHRRSRVLTDLGRHQEIILERIQSVLAQVLKKLDMKGFSLADVEAQITASNDGDFFHGHSDNGNEKVASRYLTFVYFFHKEPRQFEGGDLRIHDAQLERGEYVSAGSYQTITPQQNQIVFFPCELLHEITPVACSSRLFADSRFTLNGWLRR
jgi:Rps23 Pro-64 3,4-dihydroxylase Tpa1-like proline 4-hydroxylase